MRVYYCSQTKQRPSNSISNGLADLQARLREGFEAAKLQFRDGPFTLDHVDSLQKKLQSLSLSEEDVTRQQSILQSLTFSSRRGGGRRGGGGGGGKGGGEMYEDGGMWREIGARGMQELDRA